MLEKSPSHAAAKAAAPATDENPTASRGSQSVAAAAADAPALATDKTDAHPRSFVSDLIRTAYSCFNARDIDGALSVMHPDVDWANGMEGGRVHGHEGVRKYWTRQWRQIDPRVEPRRIQIKDDGRVNVEVHQVVRDLAGRVLADQIVHHVYEFEGNLVKRMEINP